MAIANFFYSEHISNNVAQSSQFKKMLHQARLVGKDFQIPDRNKIGGNVFLFVFYFLFSILIIFVLFVL